MHAKSFRFFRISHGFFDTACGSLYDAAPRAQVSSAHLKLDARLVRSAPLASMSLHLDAQNDKFMLKRAQKKKSSDKERAVETKKKNKKGAQTKTHEQDTNTT